MKYPRFSRKSNQKYIKRYYAEYYTRMGEIDSLFWKYAEGEGVNSEACRSINRLFSQAVDMMPTEFNELEALKKAAPTKVDDGRVWRRMQREAEESETTPIRTVTSEELLEFLSNDPIGRLLPDEEIRQSVSEGTWRRVIKAFRKAGKDCKATTEEIRRGHEGEINLSRLVPCRISELSFSEFVRDSRVCEKDHRCVGYCRMTHSLAENVVQKWKDLISQGESDALAKFEKEQLTPVREQLQPELERKRAEAKLAHDERSMLCEEAGKVVTSLIAKLERASEEGKTIEYEISGLEREIGIVRAKKKISQEWFVVLWETMTGPSGEEKKRQAEEDQLTVALVGKRQSFRLRTQEQQNAQRDLDEAEKRYEESKEAYTLALWTLSSITIENEKEFATLAETRSQFLADTAHLRNFVEESLRVWRLWQERCPVHDAVWELSERERRFRWWLQSRIDGALHRECKQLATLNPVYTKKRDIMRKLEKNQVVILSAEPGSGKTTHVPTFLYDFEALSLARLRRMADEINAGTASQWDIFSHPPSVACTQPRRIAVKTMHAHVSKEFGNDEEGFVGYRMREDSSKPPAYRRRPAIEYMTDGILRYFISGGMKDFDAVMIDEVTNTHFYPI